MHSASNFESDFHMDVKVICNDEAIIQKPLPRTTKSAPFGFKQKLYQLRLLPIDILPLQWLDAKCCSHCTIHCQSFGTNMFSE